MLDRITELNMRETLYRLWYYPQNVQNEFIDRLINLGLPLEMLNISGSLFTTVLIAEIVIVILLGWRKDLWEPGSNIFCYCFTLLLELTFYGLIVIGAFLLLEQMAIADIPVSPWSWAFCFLLTDFNYYWFHRVQHEVRALWAIHNVHHSSEEYDLNTGLRLFVFGDFLVWIYFAPMVLIGFDPAQVLLCMLTIFAYAAWMHLNFVGKLGFLENIFVTPSLHRVHHGTNPQYLDKNFGGILIIWDRLLGTHAVEHEKVRYGLTKPVGTSDPLQYNLREFIAIYNCMRAVDNWSERLKVLYKGPGWEPELLRRKRLAAKQLAAKQHAAEGPGDTPLSD